MNFSKNTEDIIADFRGLPRTITYSSKRPPVQLDNLLVILKEKYVAVRGSPRKSAMMSSVFLEKFMVNCQREYSESAGWSH